MSAARYETRALAWALRRAGWTTGEICAELAVSTQDLALMLLGELAATAPQVSKMRALLSTTCFPLLQRERAGP